MIVTTNLVWGNIRRYKKYAKWAIALIDAYFAFQLLMNFSTSRLYGFLVVTLTIDALIAVIAFIVIKQTIRKVPPEDAVLVGSSGPMFGAVGKKYWAGKSGIWEDRKLIYKWDDVADVESLGTYALTDNKGMTINVGSVRLYLKDGSYIDFGEVPDPDLVVHMIKKSYLGRE